MSRLLEQNRHQATGSYLLAIERIDVERSPCHALDENLPGFANFHAGSLVARIDSCNDTVALLVERVAMPAVPVAAGIARVFAGADEVIPAAVAAILFSCFDAQPP